MSDDLTLKIGGNRINGWTDISVSMGVEQCPNNFSISMTEKYPSEPADFSVPPGKPCQVLLGSDVVITGYVDSVTSSFASVEHTITVSGRGKCQDLVDCSAQWPGGQISGADALGIARKLAAPFGIDVAASCDVGGPVPQFNIMIGETPFEIIERIGRWRGYLCYEMPDGSLVLAQAGDQKMASGVAEGENVEQASVTLAMDQRYSRYRGFIQSFEGLGDIGSGGSVIATVNDPDCPRPRFLDVVAETGMLGFDLAKKRVAWEKARRKGRAQRINVTVDSWRDMNGGLWKVNAGIPVYLPSLKAPDADWIITRADFKRSSRGTSADLALMPRDALIPAPAVLQPIIAGLE